MIFTLLLLAGAAPADAWPGFRGDGTSHTAAKSLPLKWSPAENIAWRATLPGYGQSSPVVAAGRAYTTAIDGPEKEKLIVQALDLATGKPLWTKDFTASRKGRNNPMMSRAGPTPVAGADGIVAFFESGDVIALGPDGKTRWTRSLADDHGEIKSGHGLGASLAADDKAVFVQVDHGGPSYLLALGRSTGKDLWKAERPARTSWASPIVTKDAVIASGGGTVTAYDPATGNVLAKAEGLEGNTIPSPTADGSLVLVGAGLDRRKPDAEGSAKSNCCLKLVIKDGKAEFVRVWESKKAISHHASPVAQEGVAYFLTRVGVLHAIDLATGEEKYGRRLAECWATPIASAGRLYLFGKDGVTTVLKAGPAFEVLAKNRLWTAEDFAKRQAEAREQAAAEMAKRPPKKEGKGKEPPKMSKEEQEATRYSAVGDVVYGVAAVEGCLLVRTGTELFCIREAPRGKPMTRLFFQDLDAAALRWADVHEGKGGPVLGAAGEIAGHAKIDPARQKLVQMEASGGLVCVGVRDGEDGKFQSGWMLIRSGVQYEDHGDHGHWRYKERPKVIDSRLDSGQGNPAHLYLYDAKFYIANDRLGGYTRIDPREYEDGKKGTPRFFTGGGSHITLAVAAGKVGYAAWIDGGGPNKGRVDVTPLGDGTKGTPAYSFRLPAGVIHGAAPVAGKVFFAPADGVCWVEADTALKLTGGDVKVHHIPLGMDGGRPRRTGAFAAHGDSLLFVAGKGPGSQLAILDARPKEPKPVLVPLDVKEGTRALTPAVAVLPGGKALAFIFHCRVEGSDAEEVLQVVELGASPKAAKAVKVGRSAVSGHFGHHAIAFDAGRRWAFFTNPGDGTISALSLRTLEVVATFKVGGKPGHVVAAGGSDTED